MLARRNGVLVLMSVELMLNAVNLNLVAFSAYLHQVAGQVFALFVITIAAAEVGVGPRDRPAHLSELAQSRSRPGRPAEGLTRLMLDYAWIIPAIPALSFVLILFFGKKMPKHGSEIGITALAISFVLACVTAVQWIQHVNDAEGKSAGGVLQAFGKGFLAHSGDHEAWSSR